jgi:hypothetical protein
MRRRPSSAHGGRRDTARSTVARNTVARGGAVRRRSVRRINVVVTALLALVVAGAIVVAVDRRDGNGAATAAATGVPLLASTADERNGTPVDSITADPVERVVFHIHAHLEIYVNGQQRAVPGGVGIVPPYQIQQSPVGPFITGGTAFYWLHTHDRTGVIHIESPVPRVYTLGEFFDIWGQPLGTAQVGPARGAVTALVNGTRFTGRPGNIPLHAHDVIQLAVGPVVSFHPFAFPPGL